MGKKSITIPKRPLIITILTAFGFFGVLAIIISVLTNNMSLVLSSVPDGGVPFWYRMFSLVLLFPYTFGLISIWEMKKKGLEVYVITSVLDYAIMVMFGFTNMSEIALGVVVLALLISQYSKMTGPSLIKK